ncbi:GntR family transcriptional regulator [Streptomyces sp. NPDC057199]|uniref:GntR family transcriptional regulator n=1 Tax=Streptomyces sp. NPDC057199 TaxID=3346047 RepID=UPI00362B8E4F
MSRTPTIVPGLDRVEIPEVRQAIPVLHAYLRARVLDGTLAPGTKLSQVALASQLGVSRTPLREVLRMMQEEGLVCIEPNQRTRVAGLDPRELDEVYASRILTETLAMSLSMDGFTGADEQQAAALLAEMHDVSATGDVQQWFEAHARFHQLITSGAGPHLRRQLTALADRSIRYIRIYQMSEPGSWQSPGDAEHIEILKALTRNDRCEALSRLAHHLARTAGGVLAECAPDFVMKAVPHALAIVEGSTSQARTQER